MTLLHAPRGAFHAKRKKKDGGAAVLLAEREAPGVARDEVAEGPRGGATSLGSGVVRPAGARSDWASLLKRIDLEDVLACACGGKRRVLADITQAEGVVALLSHLGLRTEAPKVARARDPRWFEAA